MKRFHVWGVAAVLSSALGCGGGNSVSGSVQGHTLTAQSAIMAQETTTSNGITAYGTSIVLVSIANACSTLQTDLMTGVEPANLDEVVLVLGNTSPVASGTFDVTTTPTSVPIAEAFAFVSGSTCASELDGGFDQATGGTITLSSISSSSASGSFTLTFGTDQVTGSFSASTCTVPDAGTTTPTCG